MYLPLFSNILASNSVFLTKSLTTGILLLTALFFVSRTVVVTKPLISGVFYQHPLFFSL